MYGTTPSEVGQVLERLIRTVPNFPSAGVLFRDITPLLGDPAALQEAIGRMCDPWRRHHVDKVAAVEARGFIFGAAVACQLGAGMVPIRKAGRLPWRTAKVSYSLEYRSETLEVHDDAFSAGDKVLIVDDLIATGGTAQAVRELVRRQDAEVIGICSLIELEALGGRQRLAPLVLSSVLRL